MGNLRKESFHLDHILVRDRLVKVSEKHERHVVAEALRFVATFQLASQQTVDAEFGSSFVGAIRSVLHVGEIPVEKDRLGWGMEYGELVQSGKM